MKKIINVVIYMILFLVVYLYCSNLNKNFSHTEVVFNEFKEKEYVDEDLNNYVLGVLACEMPALYSEEALKAQAIAIRTFALVIGDYKNSKGQCFISEEEMKQKWNNNYQKYHLKLKNIVNATNNLVVNKDDKLLKTFYFSTSNGYTIDSENVFNVTGIKSVESKWDLQSKDYKKTVEKSKSELKQILGDFNNITISKKDKTNHVEKVLIDKRELSGIEFRKKLNLRSTDFVIENKDDKYIITTYGYGHGVGMSQNGANELAKLGFNYEYILKYYYGDIEIKKYV